MDEEKRSGNKKVSAKYDVRLKRGEPITRGLVELGKVMNKKSGGNETRGGKKELRIQEYFVKDEIYEK